MYEKKKLEEAKYFYSQMIKEQSNKNKFIYNLSAFLSSARSVLQYIFEEVKNKEKRKVWYDNYISARPILRFFKAKRDFNIHSKPIEPSAEIELSPGEKIHLSDSLQVTLKDNKGNIKPQDSSEKSELRPKEFPKEIETPPNLEIKYKFDDWEGSEDVHTLCQKYIQELEDIIEVAILREFIGKKEFKK